MNAPVKPGSIRAWILAARPATLTAAFAPVAVGTACAIHVGAFRFFPALAALLGAFLIQIGANFANDLFDFEKGADDEHRIGPLRAAQAGLLSASQLRRGMVLVFAAAVAVGVYLTLVAGWPVLLIGIASIAAGVAYTGGPYPLGYHGLGDLFVMIFFGFVAVCGTSYVQALHVPSLAWLASVPMGALCTAILVVNNVRDMKGDARAGKRTVAVRFGRRAAEWEYAVLLLLSYAVPVVIAGRGETSAWVLLPLITLPWAFMLFSSLLRDRGRTLNLTLVSTARLLSVFGLLFAIGIAAP